jgi:hypothetical protein
MALAGVIGDAIDLGSGALPYGGGGDAFVAVYGP